MSNKIVAVEWHDAFHDAGWKQADEMKTSHPGVMVYSVGFLIFEDKHSYRLSQSVCEDNDTVAHVTTIPKGMVKKIRRLL